MKRRTIRELQAGYAEKRFTPLEITIQYLKAIEARNVKLQPFYKILKEDSLRQAQILELKAASSLPYGRLYGVPLTYSDHSVTSISPTGCQHTRQRKDIPNHTKSSLVHQLSFLDALLLGVTRRERVPYPQTIGQANKLSNQHRQSSHALNPASISSLSAAVASNLCAAGFECDSSGTPRISAAACGVICLKPTYKLIQSLDSVPLTWTLDHSSITTACVSDVAAMLEALIGRSYSSYLTADLKGLRVGILHHDVNEYVDAETYKAYLQVTVELSRLGAVLIDVDLPCLDEAHQDHMIINTSEANYTLANRMNDNSSLLIDRDQPIQDPASMTTAFQYISAMKRKEQYMSSMRDLFEKMDMLVMPTALTSAEYETSSDHTRMTSFFNLIELPAMSIPCSMTREGQPIGVQFAAAWNREDILIRAGYAYEQSQLHMIYRQRDSQFL
ncbi:amidase [Paenibacillus marinisediminis]